MSAVWARAIEELAARVATTERCLLEGDFDALPTGSWTPPDDTTEQSTATQRARVEELLGRARDCDRRLSGMLHDLAAELREHRARSQAAARNCDR